MKTLKIKQIKQKLSNLIIKQLIILSSLSYNKKTIPIKNYFIIFINNLILNSFLKTNSFLFLL